MRAESVRVANYAGVKSKGIRSKKRSEAIRKWIVFTILCLLSVFFIFPFFWILSTALQTNANQDTLPLVWWPSNPQWHNFIVAWNTMPLTGALEHTMLIVVVSTIGQVLSSVFCAYGFTRLRFVGRNVWFMIVLSSMMLPGTLTMIPVYIIMDRLGWLNTYYPLMLPSFFGGGAVNIFLLSQFMKTIPLDLEEAAKIDGASTLRTFLSVILPMLKPALAVVGWMAATGAWGDILGPMVYITQSSKMTLAQSLQAFPANVPFGWGSQLTMAISLVVMLPVLIGFFFLQRSLIEGINLSGVSR